MALVAFLRSVAGDFEVQPCSELAAAAFQTHSEVASLVVDASQAA